MRTLNGLAAHNLTEYRLRTLLSALAVALGVAMTIAGNMMSRGIYATLTGAGAAGDVMTFATWMVDALTSIHNAIGVVILLVAGFLIFNAFAMSFTQRRQQIGMLRSLGMTRRQVLRMALTEALLTGALGAILGVLVGPLLGNGLILAIKTFTQGIFTFEVGSATPESLAVAALLGLGATLLAVLIPAYSAARVPPLAALREVSAAGLDRPRGRWAALGVAGAGILLAYVVLDPPGRWVVAGQDGPLGGLFALLWLVCVGLTLPVLIGSAGRWTGRLSARAGAAGRLIGDNLQRARLRVTLTVLTLAVALAMIVGMTGFITFMFNELFMSTMPIGEAQRIRTIMPFDMTAGMSAYTDISLEAVTLPADLVASVHQAAAGSALVMEWRFALVPELSFLIPNYFSFVLDPHDLRATGNTFFAFEQGDWETAMPLMEAGCGVLVTPVVAAQNNAALGDTITVTGAEGPVECAIAGIGAGLVNASIISADARQLFAVGDPVSLAIIPLLGADEEALDAALLAAIEPYPNAHFSSLDTLIDVEVEATSLLPLAFNSMLLLAVLAGALGVVNTTVMSVSERRRELGLLRAVGGTRREVRNVVLGEAALMGLVGGLVGLVAGAGTVVVFVLTYGSSSWGVELDLWAAAGRVLQAMLLTGVVGLIAAPIIAAAAAWFPARSILRGTAIEALQRHYA